MFHTLCESPFITASFVLHSSFNSSFSHYYHQRCQRMLSGHVAETVAKGWQNKVCSLSHVTIICGRVHFSLTAVPVLDNPDSDSHLPEMRHVLTVNSKSLPNVRYKYKTDPPFSFNQLSSVAEWPDAGRDEERSRPGVFFQDPNVQVCWQLLHGCFPPLQRPDLS